MRVIDCQGRLKLSDHVEQSYMIHNPVGGNYRVKGYNFQIWDLDNNGWRTLFTDGPVIPQIGLGGLDTSDPDVIDYMVKNPSGANYRIKGGNFQIWDLDNSAWRTLYTDGDLTPQIGLGGADTSDPDGLLTCT